MSQGDKNALAFAFFLSLLHQDANLKDKIVIFDDPVSSYDNERKLSTVHLLADLKNSTGEEPAQKIILTHEKAFLIKLYQEAKFADANYIKITPDGEKNGTKKSGFKHCDVFVEFIKPAELSYLEELHNLVTNNREIPASIHNKLRNIFEAAFKAKYYLHLKEEIVSKKGLGCFIDKLQNLGIYDTDKAAMIRRISAKLQIPHHDNLEAKVSPNSGGDLKLIITDSLKALVEI